MAEVNKCGLCNHVSQDERNSIRPDWLDLAHPHVKDRRPKNSTRTWRGLKNLGSSRGFQWRYAEGSLPLRLGRGLVFSVGTLFGCSH